MTYFSFIRQKKHLSRSQEIVGTTLRRRMPLCSPTS